MLNFIDQLDEEQAANAEKVARAAKRAGVDPSLAVAIAFQESKLRSNPPRGSSGEIGMMQVMPGTGRGMGYDEKKLLNIDQNIEAGVKYLKKGLEATGNDPQLAAIYYNGGPGAIQAMTAGKDPDPRVYEYLRSVNSYGAFAPKEASRAVGEGDMVMGENPPAPPPPPPGTDISGATPGERFLYGGIGALAGSASLAGQGIAASRAKGAARTAGLQEAARIEQQRKAGLLPPAGAAPAAAPAAQAGAPATQQTTRLFGALPGKPIGPGSVIADAGYLAKGETGVQVYNTAKSLGATDIEAAKFVREGFTSADVYKYMDEVRSEGFKKIRNIAPGERWVEAEGLMRLDQGVGKGPRAQYVQEPVAAAAPGQATQAGGLRQLPPSQPPPPPSMMQQAQSGLQRVTNTLGNLTRPVISGAATVGRYAIPPLAGLGAGMELSELEHEYRKPEDQRDYTKMALSGIAGISGGLSLIPSFTLPAGAISGGATLLNYLREKGKQERQQAQSPDYAAP